MGRSSMVPTHFVLNLFLESRTQGKKTNSESILNFPLIKTSAYQYWGGGGGDGSIILAFATGDWCMFAKLLDVKM